MSHKQSWDIPGRIFLLESCAETLQRMIDEADLVKLRERRHALIESRNICDSLGTTGTSPEESSIRLDEDQRRKWTSVLAVATRVNPNVGCQEAPAVGTFYDVSYGDEIMRIRIGGTFLYSPIEDAFNELPYTWASLESEMAQYCLMIYSNGSRTPDHAPLLKGPVFNR